MDSTLERLNKNKNLGVIIDNCLNIKEHVENVNNKMAKISQFNMQMKKNCFKTRKSITTEINSSN